MARPVADPRARTTVAATTRVFAAKWAWRGSARGGVRRPLAHSEAARELETIGGALR